MNLLYVQLEHIPHAHIVQSIDLLFAYEEKNTEYIEMLLGCTVYIGLLVITAKKPLTLSAPDLD